MLGSAAPGVSALTGVLTSWAFPENTGSGYRGDLNTIRASSREATGDPGGWGQVSTPRAKGHVCDESEPQEADSSPFPAGGAQGRPTLWGFRKTVP